MPTPVSPRAESLLTSDTVIAHLATSVDDRPHVAPVWYLYDDGVVEVVTTGRKLRDVRQNPRVALSIQKDVDGDATWNVVLKGTATVVDDADETADAVRRINRKYGVREGAWSDNVLVRIEVGSSTYTEY